MTSWPSGVRRNVKAVVLVGVVSNTIDVALSGAGHRDKWRRLTGGGCGRRPYGRSSAPGEEVGSGCYIEVLQKKTAADGGGGSSRRGSRKIHKGLRQVGKEEIE